MELDIGKDERLGEGLRGAPQERSDAGHELGKGERLHEIVIGAALEELHFAVGLRTGGKYEDGYRDVPFTHLLAYLVPVHGGEHEVQNNEVVIAPVQRDTC